MVFEIIAWAVVIEVVTLVGRFGLGVSIGTFARYLAPLTGGYRIHHFFTGLVIALIGWWLSEPWQSRVVIAGLAIALSDVLHHSLLWLITGKHEFYLRY